MNLDIYPFFYCQISVLSNEGIWTHDFFPLSFSIHLQYPSFELLGQVNLIRCKLFVLSPVRPRIGHMDFLLYSQDLEAADKMKQLCQT